MDRITRTVQIDEELHRKMKIIAAQEGRTLQTAMDEALREYITRRMANTYTEARAGSDHPSWGQP